MIILHLHAKFQAIPSMQFLGMPETPISLRFLPSRGPKLNQFWTWPWYTCMPNFKPFFPCVLLRMPGNPNYTKFFGHQRTKIRPILTKIESFLEVARTHEHAIFWAIPFMHFLGMPGNLNFTKFLATWGPKLGQYWPNQITPWDTWGSQDILACHIPGHSFH